MNAPPSPSETCPAGCGDYAGPYFAEMAGLMAGVDDWLIRGVPKLGLPSMLMADCGHGVALCGARTSPAKCFPTGIGPASTWNVGLMEEVGAAIGRECLALGVSLLLVPMINLHRVPLNGRSFETFSEDPVLSGPHSRALRISPLEIFSMDTPL